MKSLEIDYVQAGNEKALYLNGELVAKGNIDLMAFLLEYLEGQSFSFGDCGAFEVPKEWLKVEGGWPERFEDIPVAVFC